PGGLTLRRGCSRARLALATLLLPVGAAPAGGLVAGLGPLLRTLLRALVWPLIRGLTRALQPAPGLPVEAFHLIGAGRIQRSVLAGIGRSVLGFGDLLGGSLLGLRLLGLRLLGRSLLGLRLLGRSLLGLRLLLLGALVLLFLCH